MSLDWFQLVMYYLGVILVTLIVWMICQILKDFIKGNEDRPEIDHQYREDTLRAKVGKKASTRKPVRKPTKKSSSKKAAPKKTVEKKTASKKAAPKRASSKKQKKT